MNLALWILIVINAASALSEKSTPENFRLPDSVVPFHYKLKILTKLTDDFSYNGKVWIDVEALSDVDRIVLNAKNLRIYDNETTVEELSKAALQNIFHGKHSTKKKIKRSAESEVASDAGKTAAVTEGAAEKSQSAKVDTSLPAADQNVKDVKVTNEKPVNSPIKYIYYTVQKPDHEEVSDGGNETSEGPEIQTADKLVTNWLVKNRPDIAMADKVSSTTEKNPDGASSTTEKFVTRWVVKGRPDLFMMNSTVNGPQFLSNEKVTVPQPLAEQITKWIAQGRPELVMVDVDKPGASTSAGNHPMITKWVVKGKPETMTMNSENDKSPAAENSPGGYPGSEHFVTRWVVKGRPTTVAMSDESTMSTEKMPEFHPLPQQMITKWVVKGKPEMVIMNMDNDKMSSTTESSSEGYPSAEQFVTRWVVKGRPGTVTMDMNKDESMMPTEKMPEFHPLPQQMITKWVVKGKPEPMNSENDKSPTAENTSEGYPGAEQFVTRWVVKGRPTTVQMDMNKDESMMPTEKMPEFHPMPQQMITKWVVKDKPEMAQTDTMKDGMLLSSEAEEMSSPTPVTEGMVTPSGMEEMSMKETTPAGNADMNHYSTSSDLQTSPSPQQQESKPEMEHSINGESPKPVSHETNPENHFVTVKLSSPLRKGKKYRIQFRFRGVLSDSLTGFHRVSYRKRNSRKASWLASTVFEPNEARSAFPCFDEPNFKATFDISLAHDKKYTALSNMPVKGIAPVDGIPDYQWTIFERTPKMSTYLVAFLISDLHHLAPKLTPQEGVTNTTFRFWARQDILHRMRYAAKIVPEMKNYLEKLLGVPDVIPKYDFVALPSFVSNALENWGLVSFAEKNILYSPGFSSVFSKFETTQILGHEVSHIWFGNLVTPKYWDQIWLSEGFSNFFEVVVADHIQPTWDVKTISLVFAYLKVFSVDAMHSSHPLVPQIKNLHDVNEIFDSISYQKGYFIVRMLNHTLGEETFMKGVRHYLNANKLSNVEEEDLWDAMTLYGHADGTLPKEYHLRDIMESWTRRTGYPVIDVFRDYDNQSAVVTQRRFLRPKFDLELRTNGFADEESEETRWWIPLTYTTGKEINFRDTKPKVWLQPTEDETVLTDMPEENQFVLMNIEASGLYRVNYDERNWELLIDLLLSEHYNNISVINRVQILDDLLDFARAGEISYATAFEATNYLKKEKNFLPWRAVLSNFEYISRMFRSTDSNKLFKKYVRSLVSSRFDELGLEPKKNENIMDAMNRKQIVKWACMTGHRQCTRKSLSLFRKWTTEKKPDENNPIPSNIRSVVYCMATAHGGAKDWQFLWNRYVNNIDISDKMAIISGLGCTRSARTLKKYLDWSLNESSGLRKQDTVSVFKSVARNDIGFNIAREFFKSRMADIKKYLGNNPLYLLRMVESLSSKMNQETHLQELEAVEDEHFTKFRTVPRSFKQAKERVTFNIDWLEQNYDLITDWLKKQKY